MKGATLRLFLCVILAMAYSRPSLAEDERLRKLLAEHLKWLEEEVAYIILEREREVFLSLETMEERNHFIEAFWRKRDANPATPDNEFKRKHYRRFEYANKFLGGRLQAAE